MLVLAGDDRRGVSANADVFPVDNFDSWHFATGLHGLGNLRLADFSFVNLVEVVRDCIHVQYVH